MPTKFAVSSLLLALGVCVGSAQQVAPASPGAHGPVNLNVVVTAGDRGPAIAGLPQSAFTLLDNGAPRPITSFRAVSGKTDPVKVLLVIDAVNTDFTRIAYERQQIDKFLKANEGRLAQPTALAIFTDTKTDVQTGYTTDGNALSQELASQIIGLRELRRSAGFYGAEERLDLSLKTLDGLMMRVATDPGRKFIMFLSPGWPLLSGPAVQISGKQQDALFREVVNFSAALRNAKITLYAIDPLGAGEGPGRTFYFEEFQKGITKPSQALPGDLGLQVLAVQSGGLFLGSNNDLGVLLGRAYADAAARYEITFQPSPAEKPDEYHRIQIRMAEPHDTARTTQGYYAQP